jgi:hypothetical protein
MDSEKNGAYWCYTHQRVEPLTWERHPDHLRVGPMTRHEAERWRETIVPWAGRIVALDD